ncbi:MAG: hypothetical protein WA902_23180 [Thermosynechococcaceae cyanobacterium]
MDKKSWEAPKLTTHGSIEELTQISFEDAVKVGQFFAPDQGFGLLASFKM